MCLNKTIKHVTLEGRGRFVESFALVGYICREDVEFIRAPQLALQLESSTQIGEMFSSSGFIVDQSFREF